MNNFNEAYKAYKDSNKMWYIQKMEFKCLSHISKIIYLLSVFILIFGFAILIFLDDDFYTTIIKICIYAFCVGTFSFVSIKFLKKSILVYSKNQGISLDFLKPLDQFKYYLWREKVRNVGLYSSRCLSKAISYVDIELVEFSQKSFFEKSLVILLYGIVITAFWRLIDDLKFEPNVKIVVDFLIGYGVYRAVTLAQIFSDDKKNTLLAVKQFLMRLKVEVDSLDDRDNNDINS